LILLDADWLAVPAREGAVPTDGPANGKLVLVDDAGPAGEGAPVAHRAAGGRHVAARLDATVFEGRAPLPRLTAVTIAPVTNRERARLYTGVDNSIRTMLLGGVEPRLLGSYFGVGLRSGSIEASVERYEAGHRGFPAGGQEHEQERSAHATSMATAPGVSTEDA
jgi:hypothetical protein